MLSLFTNEMDYRDVTIPNKLIEIPYPSDAIRQLIMHKCEKAVTFQEVEGPVMETDIVILSYVEKGIAKKKHVNVGKGADLKLETVCLGKKTRDFFSIDVFGKEREYRVESIVRRMIPQLTDDIMSILEPEREITAADYRAQLVRSVEEKSLVKSAAAVFNIILNLGIKQDAYSIDEGELSLLEKEYFQLFEAYGPEQGITAKEAIRNAMRENEQKQTEEEYLHAMACKELKKAVLCSYFLKKPQKAEDKETQYADLCSSLQDEFYEVIFEYVASIMKWKEERYESN